MKPLKASDIYGTWGTLLLPIAEDESILYESLQEQLKTLIASGVNGIYSNGTAGEFYNQTEAEFDVISGMLADACNETGMAFQIGCSCASPKQTLERIKRIRSLKPGAIQVILPDWSPLSPDEVLVFLEGVCNAAAGIGVVLYNPPHAKRVLVPHDYAAIIRKGIPLVGCKTAGGDEDWYAQMRAIPGLSLFVPGHRLASGIRSGAHGAYSNIACLHPVIAQHWYNDMCTDMEKALQLEERIGVFFKLHIFPLIMERRYPGQAIDKMLAWITGWGKTPLRLRWPYRGVTEAEALLVRERCRALLPEFFETGFNA